MTPALENLNGIAVTVVQKLGRLILLYREFYFCRHFDTCSLVLSMSSSVAKYNKSDNLAMNLRILNVSFHTQLRIIERVISRVLRFCYSLVEGLHVASREYGVD